MSDFLPPTYPVASNALTIWRGIRGLCPRCGVGRLFSSFLTPVKRCSHCDLDLEFADSGDGPAIFVMLIAGFIVLGIVFAIELIFEPPLWVNMLVFVPLTFVVCLGLLPMFKGVLIALQYRHKAEEKRPEL